MRCSAGWFCGAVGLVCASLGGCGGSGPGKADGGRGGTGGGGGSGTGTACNDYLTKFCERVQACAPGYFPLSGYTDIADCVSYFLPQCHDALTAPHTGRTAALVQQCGDTYASMSCTDLLENKADPACYPQGGTIPTGGPCNNDWQCASGACWQTTSPTECGICAAVTTVDQPCQVDATRGALCPDNLICTATDPLGAHLACKPIVPIGSPCVQTEICPGNAYCDPTTSVCTQLPAIGQPCDYPIYNCDPTQTASSCDGTTCKAVVAAANGQACGTVNGTDVRCNGSCGPIDDAGAGICHTFLPRGAACSDPAGDLCSFDTTCVGGVCFAPVCGGAASSATDAAVTAQVTPTGAFDRRRSVRLPWIPAGTTLRRAR